MQKQRYTSMNIGPHQTIYGRMWKVKREYIKQHRILVYACITFVVVMVAAAAVVVAVEEE
jgi:uncharacterized BrkB/YihY/UPF0761 family membrane protein